MLFLTKSDYEKMLAHCKEGLPNEACGLIGGVVEGEKQYVKKVYLLTNMDESNEHFSMDPKEQLAAVKDMRKNGYVPLGNFHSHPESPSRPSEEDKRLAYDSKANYLFFQGPEDLAQRAKEEGILIRDCSNYHGLTRGFYRIAVRTEEENKELIRVFRKILKQAERRN